MCATSVLLGGCDDALKTVRGWFGGSKPSTLPSATAAPRDCPDLRGNFSLTAPASPQGQFDLLHTPLGGGVGQAIGKPWQSVSIDGNADVALVVTYSREADRDAVAKQRNDGKVPAYIQRALETSYNQPYERKTATIQRDLHYGCKNGWLVSTARGGTYSVRRDGAGDLEGRLTVREARVISLWAETGAGIPYWFDDKTRHARWAAVRPGAAAPETLTGLAKQEYDLTYGKNSPAVAKAAAANGAIPPRTSWDASAAIRELVDRSATVEKIAIDGGRYVLTLRVESAGPVSRTIENLHGSAHFQDVQDHGIVSGGNKPSLATISMRAVPPR